MPVAGRGQEDLPALHKGRVGTTVTSGQGSGCAACDTTVKSCGGMGDCRPEAALALPTLSVVVCSIPSVAV